MVAEHTHIITLFKENNRLISLKIFFTNTLVSFVRDRSNHVMRSLPFFFFGDISPNPDILSGLQVGWISGSNEFLTDNDEGKGGSSKSGLTLSLNVIVVAMAADAELVGLFFCLTFTGSQPNETSQSCGADRAYINKDKY